MRPPWGASKIKGKVPCMTETSPTVNLGFFEATNIMNQPATQAQKRIVEMPNAQCKSQYDNMYG